MFVSLLNDYGRTSGFLRLVSHREGENRGKGARGENF